MKKILAILLMSTMALSLLVACTEAGDDVTDAPSDTVTESKANETESDLVTEDENTETETETETDAATENNGVTLTLDLPKVVYSYYPGVPFSYSFSDESKAEELTFTTNDSRVKVEDGKIVANGNFATAKNVKITAKSENFEVTQTVRVMNYDGGLSLESTLRTRLNQVEQRSNGNTDNMVLFVGDSFFNPDSWWSSFYTDYASEQAYTVGISATTTADWQIMSERLVYPYNPKAVVVHCGTNDIFDDSFNGAATAAALKKLFETYHERMPETTIYWFNIEPRVGRSFDAPKAANDEIKAYAADKPWLVYIDSASWCFDANGNVKSDFFKDGVHPQNECYALYRQALIDAGLTFEKRGVSNNTKITDIIRDKEQNIGAGATPVVYRGQELVTQYVISGKFTLTDIKNNGHAEFQFNSYKNRFLIWDKDNDKQLGVGWAQEGSSTVNESGYEEFTLGSTPLVIEFKLLFTEKNAYLYLDGKLKAVYYNVISPTHLVLSTEGMTASFTELTAYTKAADADKYNEALAAVATYEAETGTTTRVVRVTN